MCQKMDLSTEMSSSSILEETKSLATYSNYPQLMNRELRYIPHFFNGPLGSLIFKEICQFINRELISAGVLYYVSHGKICRVTEFNGSTYSLLESLFNERMEMKRESKYTVSVIEERWFLLGASVCCICVNGLPVGTGFLLFDRYILTNAHVIKRIINEGNLLQEVSIMFTFDDMKGGTYFLPLNVKPEVVVGWFDDNWQIGMDFVLLELDLQEHEAQILPPALLSTYGPPSGMGDIYIIGHPGGGGKTSELCPITEDPICLEGRIFRYKTNFTEWSSGSPIFGKNFEWLGMHTGGDKVSDGSAIGFGIFRRFIVKNLILLMIQQNKGEPLSKFFDAVI
ncbi:uncharacterized protein LOC125705806 isoform X2 [Brienomyrus brachyistius]|uniref:uncharacterized protein LOC125705806 isoform X2 n=1 Tax=Brienomyrus brachyistius TaxID=42636 RepID=UPI0020B26AB2|nr:uncharacterized protein LOC125705806 isoform X2 [Brienomyrus brachyistius]